MALTAKQKKFCNEYIKDFSVVTATKKAGYKQNYGYHLLEKKHIQEYLAELKKEIAARNELDVDKIIDELKSIAFDDVGKYLNYRTVKTQVGTDKEGNPIIGYKQVIDMIDSDLIDTKNIKEISNTTQGFKIKLYERDKALMKLLDYLISTDQIYDDTQAVDFRIVVDDDPMTEEEKKLFRINGVSQAEIENDKEI